MFRHDLEMAVAAVVVVTERQRKRGIISLPRLPVEYVRAGLAIDKFDDDRPNLG